MSGNPVDDELRRRYALASAERATRRRRRRVLTAVAVSVVVLLGVFLFVRVVTRVPRQVTGTVRCMSGAQVQGIWVKEARGLGGFVDPKRDPADPSTARYVRELRGSRTYGVNVGCGGTWKKWEVESRSKFVSGTSHRFECHDQAGDPLFRQCVPAGR
ncbi:hypothetical protein AB0P21_23515 [Kribbella sp. NPDC056861]|uniref:hypothetical protein n=1 Tax=Kribbella sp. NPDC056861 TaxID=3154857 RepID=UPI003446DDF2